MNRAKLTGFTLIELMLSMTFISLLLIAVAMTTIQISNIYNKGITLREVNQAGRAVSDELQRSIAHSAQFDVTPKVDESPATQTSKYVVRDGGGRLCLGAFTYAWNYGKALAGGAGAPAVFNRYADGTSVRFVKVADAGGSLCATATAAIPRDGAVDLLTSGDRDLSLHSFTITKTDTNPIADQALYAVAFVLGTNDRGQLAADDASCKSPADGVGDQDYCAVNQFDIVARAGNTTGGE